MSSSTPPEAYEAGVEALSVQVYGQPGQCDPLQEADARAVVDAVVPIIRRQVAEEIEAHADRHAPKDGNLAQQRVRRHLHIAARVAAGPVSLEEVAEALSRAIASGTDTTEDA